MTKRDLGVNLLANLRRASPSKMPSVIGWVHYQRGRFGGVVPESFTQQALTNLRWHLTNKTVLDQFQTKYLGPKFVAFNWRVFGNWRQYDIPPISVSAFCMSNLLETARELNRTYGGFTGFLLVSDMPLTSGRTMWTDSGTVNNETAFLANVSQILMKFGFARFAEDFSDIDGGIRLAYEHLLVERAAVYATCATEQCSKCAYVKSNYVASLLHTFRCCKPNPQYRLSWLKGDKGGIVKSRYGF